LAARNKQRRLQRIDIVRQGIGSSDHAGMESQISPADS
jgi:hypothetical protein